MGKGIFLKEICLQETVAKISVNPIEALKKIDTETGKETFEK